MAQGVTSSNINQSKVMVVTDHLSQLPGELIDNICAWLPKVDMRNFRLTSQTLKEKSDHAFTVCYFKTTQVMLTRESLETLINKIANDKRYGPNVKELQICLVTFPLQGVSKLDGLPLTKKEIEDFEMISPEKNDAEIEKTLPSVYILTRKLHNTIKRTRKRLYRQYHHAQNELRTKCADVTLLAEALRHLPYIESITILDQMDGLNPPWGARQVQLDIGMWPFSVVVAPDRIYGPTAYGYLHNNKQMVKYFQRFCTHTMGVVFGALLRSSIKLKRALRIEGAPYSFLMPSKSDSRRLFPAATPARTFSEDRIQDLLPAFSELKELSLKTFHYQSFVPDNFALTDLSALSWIEKFVPLWSSVSTLSIAGAEHTHEPSIFSNLSTFPHSATAFPHLRRLSISDTLFRIEDIIQLLHSHRSTLSQLYVHNCRPVSSLTYLDLLRAMTALPVLLSVDLIRVDPKHRSLKYYDTWMLEGIPGLTRFEIKKGAPETFHTALEERIGHILEGGGG